MTLASSDWAPKYVEELGNVLNRELRSIRSFHGSSAMTGRAVEKAVIARLRQFLPERIDLGSGLVCYGPQVSGQIDIVLFDRLNAPVFGSGSNRIYPCEGVIAIIEVKSTLDGGRLRTAFDQVKPVKAMKREPSEVRGRQRPDAYVLGADSTDIGTLAQVYVDLVDEQHRKDEWLVAPDIVVSLDGGVLAPCGEGTRVALGPTPLLSHKRGGRMGLNRALSYDWFSNNANDGKEIQTHGAQ